MREAFGHLWDTRTFLVSTAAMSAAKWTATLTFGVELWLAFMVAFAVKAAIWVKEFRSFKKAQKENTLAPKKRGPFIPTAFHAALGVTLTAYFAAFIAVVITDPSGQHLNHHAETAFFFAAGTAIATALVWLGMASWSVRIRGILWRDFLRRQFKRETDYLWHEIEDHNPWHREES